MAFVLNGIEVPKEKWYLYILQQFGIEGWERWNASIEASVTETDHGPGLQSIQERLQDS